MWQRSGRRRFGAETFQNCPEGNPVYFNLFAGCCCLFSHHFVCEQIPAGSAVRWQRAVPNDLRGVSEGRGGGFISALKGARCFCCFLISFVCLFVSDGRSSPKHRWKTQRKPSTASRWRTTPKTRKRFVVRHQLSASFYFERTNCENKSTAFILKELSAKTNQQLLFWKNCGNKSAFCS